MNITVSGLAATGKDSVAKLLAKKLGYKHHSAGQLQRQLAKEQGLTITEWGELEKKDPKYDKLVDSRTAELLKTKEKIVFDCWMVPPEAKDHALKIFLECEENERARRRLQQKRPTEKFKSFEEVIKDMRQRVQTNRERWINYYNHDFLDLSNYDFVIDTTKLTVEQVAGKILEFIKDFS